MKTFGYPMWSCGARLGCSSISIPFLYFATILAAAADNNSWTKSTSGYWEEQTYWSLGILPDATQDVLFTNSGWKALAIGTNAAQKYPQSMRVQSLRLGAPVDSFNTLLLNFTGFEQPLQTESLIVDSNSAVVMQGSALEIISTSMDGSTGNLSLGGTMNHGDYSQVKVHGALRVGSFSQGAYFLTNGTLTVDGLENIGGFGPGKFVQYEGVKNVEGLQVLTEGEYHLYGGQATATNGITVGMGDFATSASFYQYGGSVNGDTVINGHYILNGGSIAGRMSVPSGTAFQRVNGSVRQNGGTNSAISLDLGHPNRFGGAGYYVLSNGVLRVDSSATFRGGQFSQYNGFHTIVSNLVMQGTDVGLGIIRADYLLAGGTLSAGGLTLQAATFQQDSGSNLIAGDLVLNTASPRETSRYTLGGGSLSARNVIVNATDAGGFLQIGGSHEITEKLTVQGTTNGTMGYTFEGGTLAVKDIYVGNGAIFQHTSGNIIHSGVLMLSHGDWHAAAGDHALGPLQLTAGEQSGSELSFPSDSSILRLANSSAQPWDFSAILYINNWRGSASGGGETQLFFGTDANGLTSQQLAVIRFSVSGALYPARILATGEVVPLGQQLSFSVSGNTLMLTWEPGWILQSSTNVAGPYQDVQDAASPYTPSMESPSQFFRLRQ